MALDPGKAWARWRKRDTPAGQAARFRAEGDRARDARDWDAAVSRYRASLRADSGQFAIWVQLGHASKEAGDLRASEQAYLQALSLTGDDPDLLLNLGHLMKRLGRGGEAADFYGRSHALNGNGEALSELVAAGIVDAPRIDDDEVAPPADHDPFVVGGRVRRAQGDAPVVVRLLERGREIARTTTGGGTGTQRFALRLPPAVCDGRPHGFELTADREPIGAFAAVTPFYATPADALAGYADAGLRGRLSTVGGWRLAALDERLSRAAASGDAAALAPVMTAHRFLTDGPRRAGLDEVYAPLALPEAAGPVASIIIPAHDNFAYTYRCLASLIAMPVDMPFEVVLVDDGSSDATRTIEDLVTGLTVVRNATAQGFVHACNRGASAAQGRYVVLLNNDTEVSPHWLDRLLDPFEAWDDVGLVGGKLLFGDGRLQEAGGLIYRDGGAANFGRLGNPRDPAYNYLRDADYCSGALIALPKTLWDDLGGFDSAFAPAYYEDTDLAFRVRAAGRRVLYQPLAEILHFEGVTGGTDLSSGTKRYQAEHEPIFRERWRSAFPALGRRNAAPGLTVERTYPLRALVIDTEIPQPDRSAGHHAAVQEMRLLQALGYRVTFLPLNLAYLGRYSDMLAAMGVETITAPFCLSPVDFLVERGEEFDLVFITRFHVAQTVLPLVRLHASRAKVVFNNADLHFLRAIRDAMAEPGSVRPEDTVAMREQELAVMEAVDLTLSYTEIEHAVIQSHTLGRVRVALCPWVVEPRAPGPDVAARSGIAFLGGFRHRPNVGAVRFFATEVMPLLRARGDAPRFHVYGSHPPDELAALAGEDVAIEGYVDRVEDAFDRARVFVAPLLTGAGIKGKVIEALASGLPSVLSPLAAEGVGVRDGVEALIAETPGEWAAAVSTLLADDDRWRAMSAAARAFVAERYGFARGEAVLRRGFEANGIPAAHGPACRTIPLR